MIGYMGYIPMVADMQKPFGISAVDICPSNRSPRIVTLGGYGFQERVVTVSEIRSQHLSVWWITKWLN